MGLFKRKAVAEDDMHCPVCRERVPDGAVTCAMCGHALEPPRPQQNGGGINDFGAEARNFVSSG
jgi:predicted nucleic acid-binding Zn ribbon protein